MSEKLELLTQRIAPRFGQRHFVPRIFGALKALDAHARFGFNLLHIRVGEITLQLDEIRLSQSMRAQKLIGELAVIREKEEARRVILQPADEINSRLRAQKKFENRAAALGVSHRCDHVGGFVKREVEMLLWAMKQLSADLDVIFRSVGARAYLGYHLVVHR